MTETNLKPCPFCGSPAIVRRQRDYTSIGCSNDACQICPTTGIDDTSLSRPPRIAFMTEERATEVWQSRAS